MLQQIIRSVTRAILGRVSEANERLRISIGQHAATAGILAEQQQQTNEQLWADVLDKERRIVDNRLDTNKLQDQALAFEKNAENLVRDLESHKTQIWADVLDKERRIVDNSLGIDSLRQETEQIHSNAFTLDERVSDLSGDVKQMFGGLSNSHYKLEADVAARFDAMSGMIDDTNLDSIREIADRIKAEAQEAQTIRQEMQLADSKLNGKFDSLLPAEMQNKTAAEWEQFIEEMVTQELAAIK